MDSVTKIWWSSSRHVCWSNDQMIVIFLFILYWHLFTLIHDNYLHCRKHTTVSRCNEVSSGRRLWDVLETRQFAFPIEMFWFGIDYSERNLTYIHNHLKLIDLPGSSHVSPVTSLILSHIRKRPVSCLCLITWPSATRDHQWPLSRGIYKYVWRWVYIDLMLFGGSFFGGGTFFSSDR